MDVDQSRSTNRTDRPTFKGLLISFDGTDSSGKATQARLFEERAALSGRAVDHFETPDYSTPSGQKLKLLFQGAAGSWDDLSWREQMKLLAANRTEHRQEVIDALQQGHIVVYDRYVPSSLAHMTVSGAPPANIDATRTDIQRQVAKHEYEDNGMPPEDLSIFLDVPPNVAVKLLEERKTKNADVDEQTDRLDLQERIYQEYQFLAASDPQQYVKIDCLEDSKLLTPDAIAAKVWQAVMMRFPQVGEQEKPR